MPPKGLSTALARARRRGHPKALAIRAAALARRRNGRARPHNVAMLHLGRCGSTVVADLLRQHDGIRWDGETLQRYGAYEVPKGLGSALDCLQVRMDLAGADVFGFETKFLWDYHLRTVGLGLDAYVQQLRALGFDRFIVVRRGNYLRWAASETIAARTKKWHERGAATQRNPAVPLDVDAFQIGQRRQPLREWFAEFDRAYEELASLLPTEQCLYLSYEEDIEGSPVAAYHRVCDFLDQEPQPVTIRLRKTNPYPLEELVGNLKEVRTHLAGTAYAMFLPRQSEAEGREHAGHGGPPA